MSEDLQILYDILYNKIKEFETRLQRIRQLIKEFDNVNLMHHSETQEWVERLKKEMIEN